jgi:urease accessory protein
VLRHCRYTLPLQVLAPLTLEDGTSYLLMLNPTGGVLGGDHLRTGITLGENSAACLSTPSATRIYRTTGAHSEIHTQIQIAANATLEYLPDHSILHAGSALRQSLKIEMQPGSRGIFLDAFAAGQVAQNKSWQFREFDSSTEITLREKLIYLSRTKIDSQSPLATSHSSLPAYSASLIIIADQFPDWRPVAAALRAELDSVPGINGGVSQLTESGCSARYLASSAIALQEATSRLWTAARGQVLNLPPLDLRKY